MKTPRVYVCEDSLEGILSGVHIAYMSRYGHEYQSIEIGMASDLSLFTETIPVTTDVAKAERVAEAIIRKISGFAWRQVKYASMACDADKGDVIYKFLVRGFHLGPKVTEYLVDPIVCRMMKLWRAVSRETDHMEGFLRFRELDNGLMFAKIAPKHRQLPLMAEHFTDRFPLENWMIYDEKRHEVCVHEAGKGWCMSHSVTPNIRQIEHISKDQEHFETLWKTFYETIGIEERENPRCRMQMMPKMYWKNMSEMAGKK